MDYISAKEAAEKWKISVRWVQICCKRGTIPGVTRIGRDWMIPVETTKPQNTGASAGAKQIPLPLLCSAFPPGKCRHFANSFADADTRAIAKGEYYYFSGQAEKACKAVEPYLNSKNSALQLSAVLIYAYANLSLGRTQLSGYALTAVLESVRSHCKKKTPPQIRAVSIFIAHTASVLLHLSIPDLPPMSEVLPALPPGLRFFSCYISAHQAYLDGDYSRSLGLCEAAFAVSPLLYPIPAIYLHLISAVDYMSLKRPQEAKDAFYRAWALAKKDDLIEAFGEHHGLLEGLLESCLRKDAPEEFQRIIAITYSFSAGWRQIHNLRTNEEVADNLSTTEFTIAMLANRGWSNQDIAEHLALSIATIKAYMSKIYQKLGIINRSDLKKYMLR